MLVFASLLSFVLPTELAVSAAGVRLSLQDMPIANNSYVGMDSIGSDDHSALLCHTDNIVNCCNSKDSVNETALGNWYFANGESLENEDDNMASGHGMLSPRSLIVTRGQGVVRLLILQPVSPVELGQLYCQVPNIKGENKRLFINLMDIRNVSTNPSQVNVSAGENVSVNCSVSISPYPLPRGVPHPMFEWLIGPNNATSLMDVRVNETRNNSGLYVSTLQFFPLQVFHQGSYKCRVGNNTMLTASVDVSTHPAQVTISDNGTVPSVGQSYTLTCNGIANINILFTWRKDEVPLIGKQDRLLTFPSLYLSNAGGYTCEVEVASTTYRSEIKPIYLHIPPPASVVVTSNKPNPIRPVGSNVTLTCIVKLNPAVDIGVVVTTAWTRPDRVMVMIDDTSQFNDKNNTKVYTSNFTIESFESCDSGNYTCTATVMAGTMSSQYLNESGAVAANKTTITTGVYISLRGKLLTNTSMISILNIRAEADVDSDTNVHSKPLICFTDKQDCCPLGEWYLPDGSSASQNESFLVTREDGGRVLLRRSEDDVLSPTGSFCCSVTNIYGVIQSACVNVVPPASHEIIEGEGAPTVGQNYTLSCQVSGINVFSYQWLKDGRILNKTESILSFFPLNLHHAGHYTCNINMNINETKEMTIQIPAPASVILTASMLNPILPGSEITLNCSVVLSPVVMVQDIQLLMIEVQFYKDGILVTSVNDSTVIIGTALIYSAEMITFERNDSGNYTCNATLKSTLTHLVTSHPSSSDNIKVSTGVYMSLNKTIIANKSNISITGIGEGDGEALLCFTDLHQCCDGADGRTPEGWYFPNGSAVGGQHSGNDLYFSRGPSVLRLHRKNNVTMPDGLFHCLIRDASGIIQNVYVNVRATNNGIPSLLGTFSTFIVVSAAVLGVLLVTVVVLVIVVTRFGIARSRLKYHVGDLSSHKSTPKTLPLNERNKEYIEMKERHSSQNEGNHCMDSSISFIEHEKPIPVTEFRNHVESLHANRDRMFEIEYKNIPGDMGYSHSEAVIPHNVPKNRFVNVFPYNFSRVKLKEIPGEECSDYINASYLDGYNKPNAYIGAQGPLPNTVHDFWRMIWEKQLSTIVMLTRCHEGRKKCEEYWPVNANESMYPGQGFAVTLLSTLPFAEYTVRKLSLSCSMIHNSSPLEVTQFHFTGWPDHGVPQNGVVLINFIKRVRAAHPYFDPTPLLVHCSAGVGRTGAFMVLDSMLQRMEVEENLNIYQFLKQLRRQRVLMVQTQTQYNFVHDVLNEFILCGDTEILAPDLKSIINWLNEISDGESGFCKQFTILEQICPSAQDSDCTAAKLECNVGKNRYANIIPNDYNRVRIHATAVPGSDYINASFVDGYRQRKAYIATQTPMENTVNDFWRMVSEHQSRCIVMLCRKMEEGEEQSHEFLPNSIGDSETYDKVTVKLVDQDTSTDLVTYYLEISEYNPRPHSITSRCTMTPVTLFKYMHWSSVCTPHGTSTLLELIGNINRVQMSSGNKPITIMCKDGVGRTGTFICIHAQLERLKTEGVVDFFQSIKSARMQRAGLVSSVDQYILCHNVVAGYIDGFDIYANFKDIV